LLRAGVLWLVHALSRRPTVDGASAGLDRGRPRGGAGSRDSRSAHLLPRAGQDLLCPGAWGDGAAAKRAQVLQGRLRAPHPRAALPVGVAVARIDIDGQPYEVANGQNLLHICLTLGFDLPYFCWHPAMGSVGACRQCAVKEFHGPKDTQGQIVMSCMTAA